MQLLENVKIGSSIIAVSFAQMILIQGLARHGDCYKSSSPSGSVTGQLCHALGILPWERRSTEKQCRPCTDSESIRLDHSECSQSVTQSRALRTAWPVPVCFRTHFIKLQSMLSLFVLFQVFQILKVNLEYNLNILLTESACGLFCQVKKA